jgi:hypothetical protein
MRATCRYFGALVLLGASGALLSNLRSAGQLTFNYGEYRPRRPQFDSVTGADVGNAVAPVTRKSKGVTKLRSFSLIADGSLLRVAVLFKLHSLVRRLPQ